MLAPSLAKGRLQQALWLGFPALLLSACGGDAPATQGLNTIPPPINNPTTSPGMKFDTAEYRRSGSAMATKAIAAWEAGVNGQGIVIGFVDSGISDPLGEFVGRISSASRDVAGLGRSIADPDGHGTAVAAIAAAARNDQGIVGIAHKATIAMMRADYDDCAESCHFRDSAVATGVDAAVDAGAKVINISLGGSTGNSVLRLSFARAASMDRVMVVAAGNDSSSEPDGLALAALQSGGNSNVLIVGAVDASNVITDISNHAGSAGANFLLAPGERVRSFDQTGASMLYSGTSMAAPAVSAAVALLAQAFPNLSAGNIVEILLNSADDLGRPGTDEIYGRGLLNISRAMAPSGITTLANTAVPVSMAASGTLGGAFGDGLAQAAGLARVPVEDAYGRAYQLNLARNLTLASPARLSGRLQAASLWSAGLDATSGPFTLALQIRATGPGHLSGTDAFRRPDVALAPLGFAQRGVDLHAGERNPLRETRLRLATTSGFALVAATGRLADESLPGAERGGFLADDGLFPDDGTGASGRQLLMAEQQHGALTLAVAAARRQMRSRERNGIGHEAQQNRVTFAASLTEGPWRLSVQASSFADAGALLGTRLSPGFGLTGGEGQLLGLAADYSRNGYTLRLAGSTGRMTPQLSDPGLLRADGQLHSQSWSASAMMPAGPGRLSLHLAGPMVITGGRFHLPNGTPLEAAATAREVAAELGYQVGPVSVFLFQRYDAGNVQSQQDQGGGFTFRRDF